jgi:hypothetical protein
MNGWMVQKLMEERQRDLMARSRRTRRPTRPVVMADMSLPPATSAITSATKPRPTAPRPEAHRPTSKVIGEWLIRAGTRLGGASVQAS